MNKGFAIKGKMVRLTIFIIKSGVEIVCALLTNCSSIIGCEMVRACCRI